MKIEKEKIEKFVLYIIFSIITLAIIIGIILSFIDGYENFGYFILGWVFIVLLLITCILIQ